MQRLTVIEREVMKTESETPVISFILTPAAFAFAASPIEWDMSDLRRAQRHGQSLRRLERLLSQCRSMVLLFRDMAGANDAALSTINQWKLRL